MTAIDSSVREFSIAFYPPAILSTIFFIAALAATVAAGTWLGMRFYLHKYGMMTEGTVTDLVEKSYRIKANDSSPSTRSYTRYLTIEFAGSDGVKRTVKGKNYSSAGTGGSRDVPKVGGKVPVVFSKSNPDNAMYYDRVWHYLVPVASLVAGLFFTAIAVSFCYKDIRIMNSLSLSGSGWTEDRFRVYQDAIVESSDAINRDKNDAGAYERRGDAQFATARYGDAIADYSEALRLQPDRRELLLKRSKAEWLDGRDSEALRDWLKSR